MRDKQKVYIKNLGSKKYRDNILRGRVTDTQQPHKLRYAGSSPASATN